MYINYPEADGLHWQKARRSVNNGACVEVAALVSGQILVRDSMDKEGLVMRYPERSWHAFVASIKKGRFDLERLWRCRPLSKVAN